MIVLRLESESIIQLISWEIYIKKNYSSESMSLYSLIKEPHLKLIIVPSIAANLLIIMIVVSEVLNTLR